MYDQYDAYNGLLIINGIFYLPAYNIYPPSTRCMPAVKEPDADQRARCAPSDRNELFDNPLDSTLLKIR
jgi:hypothetical protein